MVNLPSGPCVASKNIPIAEGHYHRGHCCHHFWCVLWSGDSGLPKQERSLINGSCHWAFSVLAGGRFGLDEAVLTIKIVDSNNPIFC